MAHPTTARPDRPPVRRRRRRRWPWVLLTSLVVLAALFVVADRVALRLAERKAAQTLQISQQLPTRPTIRVAGFPFLTQLAAGRFGSVTITATDLDVGLQHRLHVANVTVHLHDVTVPRDYSAVHAARADAAALITYADLSRSLGTTVGYAGGGRLVAHPVVTVLGQQVRGTVSAVLHASSAGGISFTDARAEAAGTRLAPALAQALTRVFRQHVSLQGLPFHVQVTGADATAAGVVLHLSGRDLTYRRG